jgi:hypothetical protein
MTISEASFLEMNNHPIGCVPFVIWGNFSASNLAILSGAAHVAKTLDSFNALESPFFRILTECIRCFMRSSLGKAPSRSTTNRNRCQLSGISRGDQSLFQA